MVHFHHAGKHPVVVLTQELGDHHRKDTKRTTNDHLVELRRVFRLRYTERVQNFLFKDAPAFTIQEPRYEFLARQVATELGRAVYLQFLKDRTKAGDKPCKFRITLLIDTASGKSFTELPVLSSGKELDQSPGFVRPRRESANIATCFRVILNEATL